MTMNVLVAAALLLSPLAGFAEEAPQPSAMDQLKGNAAAPVPAAPAVAEEKEAGSTAQPGQDPADFWRTVAQEYANTIVGNWAKKHPGQKPSPEMLQTFKKWTAQYLRVVNDVLQWWTDKHPGESLATPAAQKAISNEITSRMTALQEEETKQEVERALNEPYEARFPLVAGVLISGQVQNAMKAQAFAMGLTLDIQKAGGVLSKTLLVTVNGPRLQVETFLQWMQELVRLNG